MHTNTARAITLVALLVVATAVAGVSTVSGVAEIDVAETADDGMSAASSTDQSSESDANETAPTTDANASDPATDTDASDPATDTNASDPSAEADESAPTTDANASDTTADADEPDGTVTAANESDPTTETDESDGPVTESPESPVDESDTGLSGSEPAGNETTTVTNDDNVTVTNDGNATDATDGDTAETADANATDGDTDATDANATDISVAGTDATPTDPDAPVEAPATTTADATDGDATEPTDRVIDDCTVVDAPGVYTLGRDIRAEATTGPCIAVTASDVVIDGAGHTLDGVTGSQAERKTDFVGVAVGESTDSGHDVPTTLSNVTVRNLTVVEWGHGVEVTGVANATVEDVTARSNRVGVVVEESRSVTVSGATVSDSTAHGIRVKRSDDVTVTESTVERSGRRGVFVSRGSDLLVRETLLADNTVGVDVKYGQRPVVAGTEVYGGAKGVVFSHAYEGSVTGSTVDGAGVGIFLVGEADADRSGHSGQRQGSSGGHSGGSHDDDHSDHDDSHDDDSHDDDHTDHDDSSHDDDHDDHTDHGSQGGNGASAVGSHRIVDTTVAGADVGVDVTALPDLTLSKVVLTGSADWDVRAANGSTGLVGEDVRLDSAVLSFEGRDVALRAVAERDRPAAPAGHQSTDGYVDTAATSEDAWLSVDVSYTSGAAVTESTLRLWRHDGDEWTLLPGTDDWQYDERRGEWTRYGTNDVDTAGKKVSAETDAFGVLAPFDASAPDGTAALVVTDVAASDRVVTVGDDVSVAAVIENRGTGDGEALTALRADGVVVAEAVVPVPAGGNATVELSAVFDTPGTYALTVSGRDAGAVTVRPASRASDRSGADRDATVVSVETSDDGQAVRVSWARRDTPTVVTLAADDPSALTTFDSIAITTDRDEYYTLAVRQTTEPGEGEPAFDGDAPVGYLTVDHSVDDRRVTNATIAFSVARSALDERGVTPEQVVLFRHVDGEWVPLPTNLVETADDRYRFETVSPGLSHFAVGAARPVFEVRDVTVGARTVEVGDTVVVTATVANAGGANGTYADDLTVDGVLVASASVDVPANATRTISVEAEISDPGTYALAFAGSDLGVVTVEPASQTGGSATTADSAATASDAETAADAADADDVPETDAAESETAGDGDDADTARSTNGREDTTVATEVPGFGALAAVVALLAAALLALRRTHR